jgi:quercetin dioxygenase-like cupin family protein
MHRWTLALLVLCLPTAAQERLRRPQFPPDVIAHDSPIRDIAKLDTKHVRVDTENSQVRVLRITLGAGESLQMHDARDGVLICLNGCSLTATTPVGYMRELKLVPGQTMWLPAERHRIANGAGPAEFLYIEAKRPYIEAMRPPN